MPVAELPTLWGVIVANPWFAVMTAAGLIILIIDMLLFWSGTIEHISRYIILGIIGLAAMLGGLWLMLDQHAEATAGVVEHHLEETYGVEARLNGVALIKQLNGWSEHRLTVLDDGEALELVQTGDRIVLLTPDDKEAPRVGA